MSPGISVIIVNYNAGSELIRCVKSVADSGEDLEILVVDNDSCDGSVQNLLDTYRDEQKLVTIQNNKNMGFAVACNQGSKVAKGDYLFYLNPDCEIEQGTIPALIECLVTDARVGMTGGLILNPDGSEQRGCRRAVPTPWKSLVNSLGLSRLSKVNSKVFSDFRMDREALPEEAAEVDAISGACMMVKKEAYEDVGPLDEKYFLHCEDLDWCMRFREKGWKVMFVPQARLMHNKGRCSASRPVFVEWSKHKGMVRFYRKFFSDQYSWPMSLLILFGIWVRFCLSLGIIFLSKIGLRKRV